MSSEAGEKAAGSQNRVQQRFAGEIVGALKERFKYTSTMQVPKLEKIVLNCGVGEGSVNAKAIENTVYSLRQISGQQPVVTKAKKSIAAFKLREGMSIGCKVTLRGRKMYDFFDRLVSVALPRVRDFRGTPKKGFDGRGNYTLGLKEQIAFPEVNLDKLDKIRGMDITFVTTAKSDDEGRALLEELGLPFRK